jgi:hypothetical protein
MKKVKIVYSTHYADYNTINGYVMAVETEDCYWVTPAQEKRAIKKLTVGGVRPNYHTPKAKPVLVNQN